MASYKNISDNWYINVDGGLGTIYVDGNLDVSGNITYVSEIAVNDAFIIVAANNNGTVNDMGLIATKVSNSAYAGLRFDVTANAWQISSSVYANGSPVAAYANIITTGGGGIVAGANTEIQFNQGGLFGASANLTFDYANNQLTLQGSQSITANLEVLGNQEIQGNLAVQGNAQIDGYQVLGNVATTPTNVANTVILYNNEPGVGRTGLYVTANSITATEVVSLDQARLYAIIY
jgi:hypothetical protein